MPQTRLLFFPVILALLLSACQPVQGPLVRGEPVTIETVSAEQEGNLLQAANEYLALGEASSGEKQARYYLRAAQLYRNIERGQESRQALDRVARDALPIAAQLDATLLDADLLLMANRGAEALAVLKDIDVTALSVLQSRQLHQLRIGGYALTENWLEKAYSHLNLDPLLRAGPERDDNRTALWETLMLLSPQVLDLFNPGVPPADDSGWFALAYAVKAYQGNPEAMQVALENWRRSYPNHPADPALYEADLAVASVPVDIDSIAVLLPDSGPFAAAAAAIREGLIAAHYSSGSRTRLQFFDVRNDGAGNVVQQYRQAVSSGASIVIGPLQKHNVEALARSGELPVPVLALNRIDDDVASPNLFQFGLAPEDDAEAIADYARQQGYDHAVILHPHGDWGQRVANAFATQWLQNGGALINRAAYDESENDFRDTLIPLLGIDESERRYQALRSTLGRSLDFEPRRRQDIDFLFLVARPLKARQLVPQLKFHRSGTLPIIATSHAYGGVEDPQNNIDLDDLIISDIPWMFTDHAGDDPAYLALSSQASAGDGSLLRLKALGVDAYRLLPQLNALSRNPTQRFDGATGMLFVNARGQIERDMRWGRFDKGVLTSQR